MCLWWRFSNDADDFLLQPMKWLHVGGVLLAGSPNGDGVGQMWEDESVVECSEGVQW